MRALWYTFAIVLVDQVTKVVVKTTMVPGESISVLGDFFKWTFTENPGMAFGFELADGEPAGKLFLSLFSVIATVLIFFYLRHVREAPASYRVSLALILGGALGNVIDRVFYGEVWGYGHIFFGNVVDFIHFDIWSGILNIPVVGERYISVFPIGNVADLSIIAGVIGVLLSQKGVPAVRPRAEPARAARVGYVRGQAAPGRAARGPGAAASGIGPPLVEVCQPLKLEARQRPLARSGVGCGAPPPPCGDLPDRDTLAITRRTRIMRPFSSPCSVSRRLRWRRRLWRPMRSHRRPPRPDGASRPLAGSVEPRSVRPEPSAWNEPSTVASPLALASPGSGRARSQWTMAAA